MKPRPLAVIAAGIHAHLRRFEADREGVNKPDKPGGLSDYHMATAYASGRFVYVRYISYQGTQHLTRERAEHYLAWLDAGNVGRHYAAERASTPKASKP